MENTNPSSILKNQHDMIIAIVNKGFTDLVMTASRKAGARGGTIMVARGTGNQEIEKYYGINVQPEKELVVIVTSRDITDKVLKAIYDEAGLSTNGQGLAFSVPVENAVGLTAADLHVLESEAKTDKQ